MQGWIATSDIADVAFEVLDVYGVKANDSCIETHVGFGDMCAKVVRIGILGQMCLCLVQMFKKRVDGLLIGFLGAVQRSVKATIMCWCNTKEGTIRCEAGLIYSVIDFVVRPRISFLNLLP